VKKLFRDDAVIKSGEAKPCDFISQVFKIWTMGIHRYPSGQFSADWRFFFTFRLSEFSEGKWGERYSQAIFFGKKKKNSPGNGQYLASGDLRSLNFWEAPLGGGHGLKRQKGPNFYFIKGVWT